jgi:IMP and pyridine-specific 5'-nucleotidase
VHASAAQLRLITFDADGTLYADGCHMEQDNKMIDGMLELLSKRVHVAIVTAAGYPGEPFMFESRIQGLLGAFQARALPKDVTDRFLMLGGECNYLLRCARHNIVHAACLVRPWHEPSWLMCWPALALPSEPQALRVAMLHARAQHRCACRYNHDRRQMEFVPDEQWKSAEMMSWSDDDIATVLDRAQSVLEEAAASLCLQYRVRFPLSD